jgi:hypothetical protein
MVQRSSMDEDLLQRINSQGKQSEDSPIHDKCK